jgi:hypothetical protein
MDGFVRCRWFVAGGWRLAFQDIAGKLVVNILQLIKKSNSMINRIFAPFGSAQTSLALRSLIAKINP